MRMIAIFLITILILILSACTNINNATDNHSYSEGSQNIVGSDMNTDRQDKSDIANIVNENNAVDNSEQISRKEIEAVSEANEDSIKNMNKEYYVRSLLELESDQYVAYAGEYIDEEGIRNIRLVYKLAKNISPHELQQQIEIISKKKNIKISDAEFTIDELYDFNEAIGENFERLIDKGIRSYGINERLNRIIVGAREKSEELKKELCKIVDISAVIFIEQTEKIEVTIRPGFSWQ